MGITREEVVKILSSLAEEKDVRNQLAQEIYNELHAGSLGKAATEKGENLLTTYLDLTKKQPLLEKETNLEIKKKYREPSYMGLTNLIAYLEKKRIGDSIANTLFKKLKEFSDALHQLETDNIETYCAS